MSTSYKFQGWLGLDPSSVEGNMKWQNYEPKTWEETDVDIKVTHCGICGSDLHTLRSGWAPTIYPCCVGYVTVSKGPSSIGLFAVGMRSLEPQSKSVVRLKRASSETDSPHPPATVLMSYTEWEIELA